MEATTTADDVWVALVLEVEIAGAVEVEALTPTESSIFHEQSNVRLETFFYKQKAFTRETKGTSLREWQQVFFCSEIEKGLKNIRIYTNFIKYKRTSIKNVWKFYYL